MDCVLSLVGLLAVYALAWIFSNNHRRMNWRLIGCGTGLMLLFGAFIFRSEAGRGFFIHFNNAFNALLLAASEGQQFVFAGLADPSKSGFILATQALPQIFFFSALIALLYHWGIFPIIIRLFARVFGTLFRTSGAESLCAASNIFVGVESGIAIRPHLKTMTRSELCTIMTVGMATVSSNVMGAYCMMLGNTFPTIAGHLLSASVLSAPAALIIAKILYPEDGEPETLGVHIHPHYDKEPSSFAAIVSGANSGIQIVLGIVALLVAVVGLVSVANMILAYLGTWCGLPESCRSLQGIMAYPFRAFFCLLGFGWEGEAKQLGVLMGTRLVSTEFAAYPLLDTFLNAASAPLSPRAGIIAAYALCGFAHLPSVAIFTGGFAALAPERTHDLAAVALRALFAATLACLATACVAGCFCDPASSSIIIHP